VYYSTHPGCRPTEAKTIVGRFNLSTQVGERVVEYGEWPGAEVLAYNAGADELTVAPRGCDPGISNIWIMNASAGDTKQTIPVDGCGSAAMSPTGTQLLLSYDLCKLSGTDKFPDLRIYALPSGAMQEVRFTQDAPSRHPFVYAPDGRRVAYGLALDRDSAAGGATSGGIWTVDTSSLERTRLWQDQGQESWAIAWSPDGSKLLVASREGENVCSFSMIDVPSAKATKLGDLTGCEEKGTLVGFTSASYDTVGPDTRSGGGRPVRRRGVCLPARGRLHRRNGLVVLGRPVSELAEVVDLLALLRLQPTNPLGGLQRFESGHDLGA
jgi:hypothetical protein